jgi:branched-chain amino acid transport system permease protein
MTTVLNGVLVGGIYALIALGMSLVFGVLKLVNLAHGELVVGGAYISVFAGVSLGMSPLASLPLVIVVAAVLGYVIQRWLLTDLLTREGAAVIVATFGLSIAGQAVFAKAAGSGPRSLSSSWASTGVNLFGTEVRTIYVIGFGLSAVLCAVVHLVLQRSRIGWMARAAAADPNTAALMGIDVKRVYGMVFAVSAVLSAVGGVVLATAYSVTPTTGSQYLLIAIAVVVVGGVGSVAGTFVGGVLLGLLQAVAVSAFGGAYRDLAVYLAFFLILATRPNGLLQRRGAVAT